MAHVTEQNTGSGTVVAISVSKQKGTQKENVPSAELIAEFGIRGDAHAGEWHRQVSLLAIESIEKMRRKGINFGPGAFAENITTALVDIPHLHIGDRIRIAGAVLEITQIGKQCHSRCAIFEAAGDCVMPREGIFARVLTGGSIRTGDEVRVELGSRDATATKPERGQGLARQEAEGR